MSGKGFTRPAAVRWLAPVITLLLLPAAAGAAPPVRNLDRRAESRWLNHLLPLPQEIAIRQKVILAPEAIGIRLRDDAGPIEANARRELEAFFKEKTGRLPDGREFEIRLGVLDAAGRLDGRRVAGAERLAGVPNADQAYLIQPEGTRTLQLAGRGEKGLYYAVRTLIQLLEPASGPERVELPLARVLDWPDFEERGLWNCGSLSLDLAPETKFNFSLSNLVLALGQPGEPNRAEVRREEIERGRLRAVRVLPRITHLNFLDAIGLYQAYPELAGRGPGAAAGQYRAHRLGRNLEKENRVPCASNPKLTEILADWLTGAAAAGVAECGGWLSERPAGCDCDTCRSEGQFVWEARAFVNAWRRVVREHPDFRIRIFISTTTDENYEKVLAELPPEVKVERACSLGGERVRHQPRDRFVNPVFDAGAARGGWLASYDAPVTANGKVETPEFIVPMSSPQRVRDFVLQLAGRGYRGVYGMLAGEANDWLNIYALAEWSWNLDGRNERELALAWATRQGYPEPEKAADWVEIMGPIEFDLYDSGFPEIYAWGEAARLVREKRRPRLGEGIFRYFEEPADFERKTAAARTALELARSFPRPELANESRVVLSYLELARQVYRAAELAAEPARRIEVAGALAAAAAENGAAIRAWRAGLGPEPWHPRVHHAIRAAEETARQISEILNGAPD
ncbi:MAG TPA: glycoside hydrolase family 20 zincin-like fold domain-containing protein [bacterium]|nr:glycoside hydrolase family 20 zincin-like fold domain-containing protein [bacterium]HNS48814.1 glycoside hydrolase family 20 zincin-like fold domain-containing protein [bacterium]